MGQEITGSVYVKDADSGCGNTGNNSREEDRIVFIELVPMLACLNIRRAGLSSPWSHGGARFARCLVDLPQARTEVAGRDIDCLARVVHVLEHSDEVRIRRGAVVAAGGLRPELPLE
jgi:hypothetical protein